MAIVKNNYIKQGRGDRARAKATIRYIQHRPGRTQPGKTEGNHMTHSTHSHCCEEAEISNPEHLWYYKTYHSLTCKTLSPEYWLKYYTGGWSSPYNTRNKAPQKDTLAHNPTASGDRNVGAPGKENERITRTLFGIDGAMERTAAYRMIDSAEKGSVFYRFVISPDPNLEDTKHDLSLREITETTMHALEDHIHKQVAWVAAVHADHTPNRHVHIVAIVPRRLLPQEFRALPQILIHAATGESVTQRRQLDQVLEVKSKEREREEEEWEL